MNVSIGFSPCPNDTFMFCGLVHKFVDCNGLTFDVHMADIEELNKLAVEGALDVTKLSIGAYADVAGKYELLCAGSALGYKNGPLLVSKRKVYPDEIQYLRIAIPGKKTTANLLLSILHPNIVNRKEYLFSDIEEAVLSGEVDAGLIIHESRFTYHKKGLKKVIDLGESWEESTGYPIPLGSIAIRRQYDDELKMKINRVIAESISFAFENRNECMDYIREHARELEESVINKHIELFVNKFSVDLGKTGKEAIEYMLNKANINGTLSTNENNIFIKQG
jgi:1,4-dihydroxy-6-naphthoate synthase